VLDNEGRNKLHTCSRTRNHAAIVRGKRKESKKRNNKEEGTPQEKERSALNHPKIKRRKGRGATTKNSEGGTGRTIKKEKVSADQRHDPKRHSVEHRCPDWGGQGN